MNNSSVLKNELIFNYASGSANLAKSLMASTYLFLNSKESSIFKEFESYCGEELKRTNPINPTNLTANDCMEENKINLKVEKKIDKNFNNLKNIKWKKIFNGFYEHQIPLSENESAKLIKMDPGAKVPLHSHNGKEYILVIDGSFCDEYGEYSKGDLQINDSKIRHTPVACNDSGCVCLTITEDDLVFYGPLSPLLNIVTFIRSMFLKKK